MRHTLKLILAAAVSLLVLGLLFRLVGGGSGLSAGRLLEILRQLAWGWIALGLVGTLAQAVIRARRYAVLLRAAGEPILPTGRHLLLVTMTRNMFVDLLPARAGELTYVALLNRGFQLRLETCLSSLSMSVLFDFAALLLLVGGLTLSCAAAGRAAGWMAAAALGLALLLALGLIALFRGPGLAAALVDRLPARRIFASLSGLLRKLEVAFATTRRAGIMGRALGLSLLVRLAKYGGFYALFRAVTQHNFTSFAAAPPPQVIGALLSAEGASAVPLPSFMSFGAYEAGGTAVWTALGFPAAEAALCMLVIHVVSQVLDYGLGGAALLLLLARRAPAPARSPVAHWRPAAAVLLVVAAAAFSAWEIRSIRRQGALAPPPPGESVAPEHIPAHALPRGRLVWSSNRSGNHDIWSMDLPGMAIAPLTHDPHAEYHPRISPDGTRIVFARSLQPWVSQRNEMDWQVVLLDLSNGQERVLADRATAPSWSGPDRVVFESMRTNVVEMDVRTGQTSLLCAAGADGLPADVGLQTPSFRAGAPAVAVTLRGALRATALVGAGHPMRRVAGGCQIGWDPGGTFLLMTDAGGRMKNAFYRVDPKTLQREIFFDAEEPWSHEYFPALSPDGRWLAYGACAKGHEHDTADYEIFLWRVGDAPDAAVRLTWHTGNDAWPDVWIAPAP